MKKILSYLLLIGLLPVFLQCTRTAKKSVANRSTKQVIILKADDLIFGDSAHVFPERWQKYLDYIRQKEVKSSVGIILNSLDKGTPAYAREVKALQVREGIELWNHGYTHQMNGTDANGTKFHEFWNTSLEHQITQLRRSQAVAREKLGLTLHTFGAAGNAQDSNTVKALAQFPDLKVWLRGDTTSNKFILKKQSGDLVEFPVHNPDYQQFIAHYDPSKSYLLLQYHPMSWDERRFGEFTKIIDYLLTKNVVFMTPYAYYQSLNP